MNASKIWFLAPIVIIYVLYYLSSWFKQPVNVEENNQELVTTQPPEVTIADEPVIAKVIKIITKANVIPLFINNSCSVLEVFTVKPTMNAKVNVTNSKEYVNSNNTIAVIGITVFLVALAINAVLDVLKVKEEERERLKLNPTGERRQSLAEFANKKHMRRQSSKFSLQLFQIAESVDNTAEEKTNRRQSRPYTRGDSTNSYLADRKTQADGSTPTTSESSEPRLVKRQSVAKLFGARPSPMVRRSSFPALPLNPDVQALMLGHRQPSLDSDDEGDGKGRRVRIIRRY